MVIVTIIAVVVAVVAVAYCVRFYIELRRWANVCNHGRIAIAYNRKVQLQAPLTEWYLWTRKLNAGETGRVVYRNGKVTVAIVKPVVPPGKVQQRIRKFRAQKPVPQAQSQQGTWSIKQDKPS